jgi:hypothetical protein
MGVHLVISPIQGQVVNVSDADEINSEKKIATEFHIKNGCNMP